MASHTLRTWIDNAIAAFAFCGVLAVSAVSGFAQTNTSAARELSHSSGQVTRVYTAARSASYDDVQLAPNVTVTSLYQPIVRAMLERSATFRRQYARLAKAAYLTIEIRGEPAGTQRAVAWTRIRRRLGQPVHAIVTVSTVGRPAELIAHELEHIIEQIDGVDLSHKATVQASGVKHCDCGDLEAFETTRAIVTGLRVAQEVGERHH